MEEKPKISKDETDAAELTARQPSPTEQAPRAASGAGAGIGGEIIAENSEVFGPEPLAPGAIDGPLSMDPEEKAVRPRTKAPVGSVDWVNRRPDQADQLAFGCSVPTRKKSRPPGNSPRRVGKLRQQTTLAPWRATEAIQTMNVGEWNWSAVAWATMRIPVANPALREASPSRAVPAPRSWKAFVLTSGLPLQNSLSLGFSNAIPEFLSV